MLPALKKWRKENNLFFLIFFFFKWVSARGALITEQPLARELMYYFVEILVSHISYLPSIYCNCFRVNGKSKNILLEHGAFFQFASITSYCLLQFSWWLCLHSLSLLPQLKNALEIIHIFEKIKAYNFSFCSFGWKHDCSTESDCGVQRVKGFETSKHSQYSSVFKPKRTKFAMRYTFINIRLSSAISRTTSLQSGVNGRRICEEILLSCFSRPIRLSFSSCCSQVFMNWACDTQNVRLQGDRECLLLPCVCKSDQQHIQGHGLNLIP